MNLWVVYAVGRLRHRRALLSLIVFSAVASALAKWSVSCECRHACARTCRGTLDAADLFSRAREVTTNKKASFIVASEQGA